MTVDTRVFLLLVLAWVGKLVAGALRFERGVALVVWLLNLAMGVALRPRCPIACVTFVAVEGAALIELLFSEDPAGVANLCGACVGIPLILQYP